MSKAFDRDVWAIMGMPLDNVSLEEAAQRVEHAVETRERLSFVTPNVNWFVRALKDENTMRQIINADLSLADGAPVVWLARQLGMPITQRVAGSDLFDHLRHDDRDDAKPIRVFFFGGREGSAEAAHRVIEKEQGRMIAAGWHNPGFGDVASMSSDDIRTKINAAAPDFVIVSLGAAKGQAWIEENQNALDAPVIAHLGAVVDFVAGSIRRAPAWMSRLGIEWLGRIFAEPSLWRRYWNDGWDLIGLVRSRLGRLKKAGRTPDIITPIIATQTDGQLKLEGDLLHANRDALAQHLKSFAQSSGDCALDLSEIRAIDAAGLGQVRMLEQSLMRRGNRLKIFASNNNRPALQAANMTLQGVT
ncbi:MAG: WecB/TagA/CpsF family glycosyltransferase [Henriciella sp.]|nr:WecB/TagA/CpsF family glycosyltransferase [Henriciella sp.]